MSLEIRSIFSISHSVVFIIHAVKKEKKEKTGLNKFFLASGIETAERECVVGGMMSVLYQFPGAAANKSTGWAA